MSRHSIALAGTIAFAMLSGCGGGTSSPTAPTNTATGPTNVTVPTGVSTIPTSPNQWQTLLLISIAAEDFLNSNILGADFYLDGVLEQRKTYSTAVYSSDLTAFKFLSPGRHTVTARITGHIRSPFRYELTGLGQFARGVSSVSFDCPKQVQSLAVGGELTCSFTLAQ